MNKKRSALITALGVVVFSVVVITGSINFLLSNERDLNAQNTQYLKEISQQNAKSVQTLVGKDLDNLRQIACLIGGDEDFSTEQVMSELMRIQENTYYKRMGYILPDGEALTTDKNTTAFDASDREYYQLAMMGVSNASNKLADRVDNSSDPINVYAVPLYHDDVLQGVLFATNNTKRYADSLAIEIFGGEGFSYIVEANGDPVVFSEEASARGEFDNLYEEIASSGISDQSLSDMKDTIDRGETGIIEYTRNDVPRIAAYSKVDVNDWYVISVVPESVIYAMTNELIFRNIVAVVVTILMSGAFILLIAYQGKSNRKRLETMAYVDKLTGGNNYNRFLMMSNELLSKHRSDSLYVVTVDIDNLRLINDMYGFKEGDAVLCAMDEALRAVIVKNDICGRISNDSFVLLVHGENDESILELDERFKATFQELMDKEKRICSVTFTAGVYRVTPEDKDISKMVDKAVMAHHHAKKYQTHKNIAFYTDKIRDDAVKIKAIEDSMYKALSSNEFLVYLQPKFVLQDESIGGMEALVRWRTSTGEFMYPNDFIPVFEQNGFIVKLDWYMLENACRIVSEWITAGITPVSVSVNFSRAHLHNNAFVSELCEVVDSFGIDHSWIEIELTETAIYDNCETLRGILSELHQAGFTMSMDDFGSGYSSLGLLKDLPVDVIKIDRSFFAVQKGEQRSKVVVGSMIEMAKKLGIHTVAEGVEERSSIDLLLELNCDMVQGYYYAKPLPEKEGTALLVHTNKASLSNEPHS